MREEGNVGAQRGLVSIFPSAKAEILDFLLIHQYWDYNKADIAKHTSVSYKWVFDLVDAMVKEGIIKKTRHVGKSDMYQANMANPYVKELKRLQLTLMLGEAKPAAAEERELLAAA